MYKEIAGALALVGLVAFVPVSVSADATSSPGKFAAAASQSGLALHTNPTLSVTIEKGKKKRLLVVAATASGVSTGNLGVGVSVNGVDMELQGGVFVKCNGSCTVASTSWLDLDQAEAANPGQFINVPLVITATGVANTITTGMLSFTANMVKK